MLRCLLLLSLLCAGCGSVVPTSNTIRVVTAIPTIDASPTITPQQIEFAPVESCSVMGDVPQLADYVPSNLNWVAQEGSQLMVDGSPYIVYGANYYPRMSPFDLFLTDSDVEVIGKELDVITPSGINTLRIFVSLRQLFDCETLAIPTVDRFTLLDSILTTIASKNLRIIVVLHQQIDLDQTSWQQVQFVVNRYQNEPAILAWDVLDRGDLLYADSSPQAVLTWLANTILAIRQVDNRHFITASWQVNAIDTAPLVDIVSFQHFGDYLPLRQKIADLKASTTKPIILSAIGYSTFDIDETAQRNLLYQAFEEVQFNALAGWVVYMALDYPTSVTCIKPDCPAKPASLNFYGIWNTSYFPKLAVDAVKRTTQTE